MSFGRLWFPIVFAATALVFLSGCGTQPAPGPTKLTFTNGQAAAIVIGQSNFTSSSASTDASHISLPTGATEIGGKLYLVDYGYSRVLGYNSVPTTNGASADFVIGQASMTSNGSGTAANRLYNPLGISAASGKLAVADWHNNRVLLYNSPPTSTGASANVAVGQTDLTSSVTACTNTGLDTPLAAFIVGTKLIVSDSGNNRILIYNTIPTANGTAADVVLGQANMTSCSANRGASAAANTLNYPGDLWSDGTRLVVADWDNNRVLIWNTFPTADGQSADVVVGQPDMTTVSSGVGPAKFYNPYAVTSNSLQLFVADTSNHRVLVFNSIPTTNGASADVVLGQPNFTSNGFGTTSTTFDRPYGLHVDDARLFVADNVNNRVLIFTP